MEKRDWLLLAIHDRLEPIQIQKTLFKFAKESDAPSNEIYTFVPYDWGPCSLEIYDDLAILRDEGFVHFVPSGRGWSLYSVTDAGQRKQDSLRKDAPPNFLASLDQARTYVTSRDFETLLEDIYEEYPEFASQSLFKR